MNFTSPMQIPSQVHHSETINSYSRKKSKDPMLLRNFTQLLSSAMSNGEEHKLSATKEFKLSQLLSPQSDRSWDKNNFNGDTDPCSFPCLLLKGHLKGSDSANRNISLLDVGALSLAEPLKANRSNIDQVPMRLLTNVTVSFKQLLCSRLRASMSALIETTVKLGDFDKAKVLRRLFNSRECIKISTVVTSYTVLTNADQHQPPGKVTEALVFEIIIDAKMMGTVHTVTLQVPGTISAVINPNDYLLQSVDIVFDTVNFLKTMMEQARMLVKKTMKRAAKITAAYIHMKKKRAPPQKEPTGKEESKASQNQNKPEPQDVVSQANKSQSKDQDLLISYPEHLRETVRQFLPCQETMVEENIEGFPPQLAKTLKALSYGGFDEVSSGSEDGGQNPMADTFTGLHVTGSSSESLGLGIWGNSSGLKRGSDSSLSGPKPLKKRQNKVSFSLPA
jgi:hypothetical protein